MLIVSQAIRIFPRGAHARGKGGGGREGKIRLVTSVLHVYMHMCFHAYVVDVLHRYVCVFVGGKEGGERVFLIAAGLCQRLPAHGFPSECAGLVYQLIFLDSGIGYSCPSA